MADLKVEKDLVISMDYELKVENSIIDYSEEGDPIVFLQGHGNIIPGLEKAIQGMNIGDSKEVFVKAADAYGEFDPENFTEVPRTEFPEEIPLEIGTEIGVNDENGEELSAYIEEVDVDKITLNFNHPLAGKDLEFKVKIVGIREATAEELEHGHIHGSDECECDCENDEDCDCEHGDHQHSGDEDCCCGKNK
jgi:FKBP-type peptidyl-prolyl cis-trans isomerase SlyD